MALTSVLPFQSGYFSASATHPAGAACAPTDSKDPPTSTAAIAAVRHDRDASVMSRAAPLKDHLCMLQAPSNLSWRLPCCKARRKRSGIATENSCPGTHKKLDQ